MASHFVASEYQGVSQIEGNLTAEGLRFCLVVSRFNDFLTTKMVDGALDALVRHGAAKEDITIVRVPGSFEIPLAAQKAARKGSYDAVVCLGALVRGATPHFNYISAEVTKGIAQVSLDTGIPLSYGIITADTLEQAIERAGTKAGNKGADAALSAVEQANLYQGLAS
jgi:6,7-dimethyl-8-ribityllumazine synthase